jgi:hypothetical protein
MKAKIRTLTVDGENLTEAVFQQLPETFGIEEAFVWFRLPDRTLRSDVKIVGRLRYRENYPRIADFSRTQFMDLIDEHLIYIHPQTTMLSRMPLGWHIMEALEYEAMMYSEAGHDYMVAWGELHDNIVEPMLSAPQLFLLE